MSNHTPGPWKVECGSVYTEDGWPIATMVRDRSATAAGIFPAERDANARLIAAAPELLEELGYLKRVIEDIPFPHTYHIAKSEVLFRVEATIAKARGN